MHTFRLSALACCLSLTLFTSHSRAAQTSSDQFLSDISGIDLPSAAQAASAAKKPVESTSSTRSTSVKKTAPPHAGKKSATEAALRKENLALKKKIVDLSKTHVAASPADVATLKLQQAALVKDKTELAGQNAALKAKVDDLKQQLSGLRQGLAAQQGSASARSESVQKQLAELTALKTRLLADKSTLSGEADKLHQQIADLQLKLTNSQQDRAEKLSALNKQQKTLDEQKEQLTVSNRGLRAESLKLHQQIADLQLKLKNSQQDRAEKFSTLNKQQKTLDEQKEQLTVSNRGLRAESLKLHQQIADLQLKLKNSQQDQAEKLSTLNKQQKTLGEQKEQLTVSNHGLRAESVKLHQQIADLQLKLKNSQQDQAEKLSTLNKQQKTLGEQKEQLAVSNRGLRAESVKLHQQIATLQKQIPGPAAAVAASAVVEKPQAAKGPEKAALDTLLKRQSYAAGVILAKDISARIQDNHRYGLDIDGNTMLAGIQDSYHGHPLLDNDAVRQLSADMDATLEKSMKQKAEKSGQDLDTAIKGKTLLARKAGVAVVLEKKGKGNYKKGTTLTFDSREKLLDGTPILNSFNSKIKYTDKLPAVIKKVIQEGKKGGHVTLYGLAGNIYTPSKLPKNVPADALVKVEFILH